ncbi:hypothetical protein ABK040_001371 [Willaertia magna]
MTMLTTSRPYNNSLSPTMPVVTITTLLRKTLLFSIFILFYCCCITFINCQQQIVNSIHFNQLPNYNGKSQINAFSGYLKDTRNGNLFFLYFPNVDKKAPLVVWLNGGPGCSSMIGLFLEIGPLKLKDTILEDNPYSWTKFSNLLIIDNPVTSGFSYTTSDPSTDTNFPKSGTEIGSDLLHILQQFYNKFPELFPNDLYLFGESYGGKYVISGAESIVQHNNNTKKNPKINLKGIAMGNAWVSPDIQERIYGELSYIVGLSDYRLLVDLNNQGQECHEFIEKHMYAKANSGACTSVLTKMLNYAGGVNAYDYRLIGTYKALQNLENYLKQNSVKSILKIPLEINYQQCSDKIWNLFNSDFQVNYVPKLINLLNLESKISVLVYNGQFDLRCSVYGTSEYLRLMDWYGRFNFNFNQQFPYLNNLNSLQNLLQQQTLQNNLQNYNQTLGIVKNYKQLTQVVIFSAGHMVPHDQPFVALDMMYRFTRGISFTPENSVSGTGSQTGSEITKPANCPNYCSGHGICQKDGICKCRDGFYELDCSTSNHVINFGKEQVYKNNILFGNTIHLYQLHLPDSEISKGLFDLHIHLKKTSILGKLHLYIHTSKKNESFIENLDIDESDIEKLRKVFKFHDLEDVNEKYLFINELKRNETSKLTLLIINTVDTESTYDIIIESNVSGKKLDNYLVASIGLFITSSLFAFVLFIVYGYLYWTDRQLLRKLKYELVPNE